MKLDTRWVDLDVGGKPAQGFLARPAASKGPLPGIVVIQEAFGVDDFIVDITERLAAAGYAALAPDLFSYGGKPAPLAPPRVAATARFLDTIPPAAWFDAALRAQELDKLAPAARAEVAETLGLLLVPERPWAQYVATARSGRELLSQKECAGAGVGCLGFCLGGAVAMRLACADAELTAAVSCYGFAPPADAIPALRAHVLALYADNDPRINAGVPALVEAMNQAGKRFSHHTFPGTGHAFVNDTRRNYHVEAARQAWARILGFFAAELAAAS